MDKRFFISLPLPMPIFYHARNRFIRPEAMSESSHPLSSMPPGNDIASPWDGSIVQIGVGRRRWVNMPDGPSGRSFDADGGCGGGSGGFET
mmetsp:Transcript_19226/g.46417  ORF Transcript_19226/g.46417 Transcript_19226/m.46417 type:complete len:91 (+) Transcript_19226:94-366(+)